MGLASVAWYVVLVSIDSSENILWDSISGLGFAIAFYYGLTALASPILFRRVLTRSWKHLVLAGVLPVLGAAALLFVFVRSAFDLWDPVNSYTTAWFAFGDFGGVGPAFVIGIGSLLIGLPLMLWWRLRNPAYFRGRAAPATSIDGRAPELEEAGSAARSSSPR
jgi:hypothetical protein